MLRDFQAKMKGMKLTPLQKVQYGLQQDMITNGKLGWTEFTMVPAGGLAAPAEANKSYMTVVAIELVCALQCMSVF
jgi:hypothetical protein